MVRQRVVNIADVVNFSPTGYESVCESKLLIDGEALGSKKLVLNHFTLKPGQQTPYGSHPDPYEEAYYILSGQAVFTLGDGPKKSYDVGPGTVAFIPAGCNHQIKNTGSEDLVMLTMMPLHPTPGANPLYDERKEKWGTSFKLLSR